MSLKHLDPQQNPLTSETHIRPGDLDSLGHVNNAVALELFEFGRLMWTQSNQIVLKDHLLPLVSRIQIAYNRELFAEPVEIITELENDQFFELQFRQQVKTLHSDVPNLQGTVYVTLIDRETRRPQRLKRCFVTTGKVTVPEGEQR